MYHCCTSTDHGCRAWNQYGSIDAPINSTDRR
jgi:hypothetical protein